MPSLKKRISMNNLQTEMAALRQGIASSADERGRVVADIKAQTNHMLRAFSHERMAMAKTLQSELTAGRVSRSAEVLAICHDASTMCAGFHQDHGRMRRSLRQSLDQSSEALVKSVATLRAGCSEDRATFAKTYRHMAKAQCAALSKDRRNRSHAVARLLHAFSKAHLHMAKTQRAGLTKGHRDRSHRVNELMQGFFLSRGKMTRELARSLAEARQQTRTQVSGLTWPAATSAKASEPVDHPAQISALDHEPEPEPEPEPETSEAEPHQENDETLGGMVRHLVEKTRKPKRK
jgi:hypothetical protein